MDKTLELIHIKIHALRMIPNYKPTNFEYELAKLISETFADSCSECKEKVNFYKYNPAPKQNSGVLGFFGVK